uniref:Tyrosinase copper-binding domain-containing protein n=1 Tax=Strigamia maritima TaxID=126957 RepID=T1J6H5_STRMM
MGLACCKFLARHFLKVKKTKMTTMNPQRVILDLWDHVSEPLDRRATFQRPFEGAPVLDNRDTAEIGGRLQSRLVGIGILPRGRIFSTFNKQHMAEAMLVIRLLQDLVTSDLRDSLLAMGFLRDRINEQMFVYVTSVLTLHQPELRNIRLPPIEEVLPMKFVPGPLITDARNTERRMPADATEPIVLSLDFTGNDRDIEHRLAYWREDIALNTHHWHWHIVYPFTWTPDLGGTKDRKGELFYYMHQQMIARYDCERMSHNLSRVVVYHNFDDPIDEGYAPHLNNDISGTVYASRPRNMVLQDTPSVPVHRLITWYNRIVNSIHERTYRRSDGQVVPLDETNGISIIGDIVEPAATGPSPTYYGDFHNSGHDLISRIHDPDERFREEMGVMGDSATAMRDPVFYRWHKFIDQIFQEHKNTLDPYTPEQLQWNDVTVQSVSVQGSTSSRPNNLQTFWQDRTFELQRGINFNRSIPVRLQTRHLQHEAFTYNIVIQNGSSSAVEGMIRLFMAPSNNEIQQPFTLEDQRHIFIELDKFTATLNPGNNTVTRQSSQSNVTVATQKSFSQLIQESQDGTTEEQISSCSCGLPDHLLIPRGKPEGMEFQLFVMVTNAQQDRVVPSTTTTCQDAASYCGILNERYPDVRPMGFPFDRRIEAATLDVFRTTNMNMAPVNIRFRNVVVGTNDSSVLFPNER